MRRVLFIASLLFFLAACGGHDRTPAKGNSSLIPPLKLQSLGIPLSAYVVTSLDPEKQFPLEIDSVTNHFQGEIEVPTDQSFDLTVVYTILDPVSGREIQIARYIRRGLIANGTTMRVAYAGDESHWETLFDLSPGSPNDLNLDGDPYNNFIETGYGSDPTSAVSLPFGPKTTATHKDPLLNSDVSLPPPGADTTSSLKGEEELILEALTIFDVVRMEVISPSGIEVLSSDEEMRSEKKIRVKVDTRQFVTGSGSMALTVRVTDEYNLTRETTLTFAVYNPVVPTSPPPPPPPSPIEPPEITINTPADGATVRDLIDLDATAVSRAGIDLLRFRVTEPAGLVDQDSSTRTFIATWDTRNMPDDQEAPLRFEAVDTGGRTRVVTRSVRVDNAPNITSFISDRALIQVGEAANLSWGVGNVTQTSINGESVPVSGTLLVRPEATTTYTLTAVRTNSLNSVPSSFTSTAAVQVRVNHSPVFGTHTTEALGQGPGSALLSWTASDLDGDSLSATVMLSEGAGCGNPIRTDTTSSSSVVVTDLSPRTDYSYEATLDDGEGGSVGSSCFNLTTADTGLVGWWRFDGDVTDSSGNGLNGSDDSPDDSPFLFESGEEIDGGAISLAGNDYVRVSHDSLLDNPRTIEMRIRTDTTTGPRGLVDKYDGDVGGAGYQVQLGRDSNTVIWDMGDAGSPTFDPVISEDVWTHLVVVTGDGIHQMYLNGGLVDVVEGTEAIQANPALDLFFGENITGGIPHPADESFYGAIDEIAIYDRALSADEILLNCRRSDPTSVLCSD